MIIFEWIEHYINTPEIQLTMADQALFFIAVSVIVIIGFAVVHGIYFVADKIGKLINSKKIKEITSETRHIKRNDNICRLFAVR